MEVSTLRSDSPVGIEELVQASRGGDLQAFEGVYRAVSGRLYALCLRLTTNKMAAEELTQDAFVRIWQKLDSFRGESAFTTWCHRLTVRLAIDRLRSEGRRTSWMKEERDEVERTVHPTPVPRDHGLRLDLEKAIATLPPGARTVFVLHDVEGYRHEEIAGLVGISEGTSKAQLHRARRLLREVIR